MKATPLLMCRIKTMLNKEAALKILIPVLLATVLAGCQTGQLENFKQVMPGWRKADIIEHLGPPHKTGRRNSIDLWTYEFFEEGIHYIREIHFIEGKVVYAGPRKKIESLTAEQVDAQNAVIDKEIDDRIEASGARQYYREKNRKEEEAKKKGTAGVVQPPTPPMPPSRK